VSFAAALSARWLPCISCVHLSLFVVRSSLCEWMCCTRFRVVAECCCRMRTRGACDEGWSLFGCRMSLYALSESVWIPVQLIAFSASASARMSARHSMWNTDVALTLSSWEKCMLITGLCFQFGESSVRTIPAVAVGFIRSGELSVVCRGSLCSVKEPSVNIFTLLRSLSFYQVCDHVHQRLSGCWWGSCSWALVLSGGQVLS